MLELVRKIKNKDGLRTVKCISFFFILSEKLLCSVVEEAKTFAFTPSCLLYECFKRGVQPSYGAPDYVNMYGADF